jgi:Cd2+/Zn2+-exporting ATPase
MIGRFSNLGTYRELLNIKDFLKVGLGGAFAIASFFWDRNNESYSNVPMFLALISIGINGLPIIGKALTGLWKKKVNVDELVSIAIIACLISGEFLTAATVSFVMVLGALIEEATSESARKAIRSLINITPKSATVINNGQEELKPITEVRVGDILLVKPGECIPVDAVIINGSSAVDESSITGEPIPIEKIKGDYVYSGTITQNGVLKIKTTKIGEDTTLGKVIKLVSEAEAHKPVSVKLIDRYAKWFTPAILCCAAFTWVLTGDFSRAVAVLIVGCPCALILAAPTAVVATIGRAAKSGILIKGGQYLEKVGYIDMICFDKTGTLTEGDPRVDTIVAAEGIEKNYVLKQAACVEQGSTHPLAQSVLKAAHYAEISISAVENLFTEIGLGVRGCVEGCTVEVGSAYLGGETMPIPQALQKSLNGIKERGATPLVVYQDKRALGIIGVADQVRPKAKEVIHQLKELNIKRIGILSGDHEKSVNLVGDAVGATDIHHQLKPQDKLEIINKWQNAGNKVMFVGDGINDAPALATSDVGVAMGAKGTEVALETADIALMHDDISKLPFMVKLSRRMLKIIKWNIVFGLSFNLIAVLASGSGFLTPIMGAVVHNIGSIIVVISSASIGFATDS